jgi:hypothetical protein
MILILSSITTVPQILGAHGYPWLPLSAAQPTTTGGRVPLGGGGSWSDDFDFGRNTLRKCSHARPRKAATAAWTAAQETGNARATGGWGRRAADGGGGGDGF